MKKNWPLYIAFIAIVAAVIGGVAWQQHTQVGFVADHTIRSGELRDTAFSLVSSAENSSLNYRKQYAYIEDIGDGRGYTAGIIGFTTGTGDLLQVVERYVKLQPKQNSLKKYLPALEKVNGTALHQGLGRKFEQAWRQAAKQKAMQRAQNAILNTNYLDVALKYAKQDDLGALGQYIYYDTLVVHGPGNDHDSFQGIRRATLKTVKSPAQGGNQAKYLQAFLAARTPVMRTEAAHRDLSRLNAQRKFIDAGNFQLKRPLHIPCQPRKLGNSLPRGIGELAGHFYCDFC